MIKKIISTLLAATMLFSMGTTVFANEGGEENSTELDYTLTPYDGDVKAVMSFNNIAEVDEYVRVLQNSLSAPQETYQLPSSRALCTNENTRLTRKTEHFPSGVPISAWRLVLITDYYVRCSTDYPTFPHSKDCKEVARASCTVSVTGVTIGVAFQHDTSDVSIYSDGSGFETLARGSVSIRVQVGGVDDLLTVPYEISHRVLVRLP